MVFMCVQLREHKCPSGHRTKPTRWPWVHGSRADVLQPRCTSVARPQGGDQETEVRPHQRKEDVYSRRRAVQGLPDWVCHVPELLPRSALRWSTGLHVPASAVPTSVPHTELQLRLRVWLDHASAAVICGICGHKLGHSNVRVSEDVAASISRPWF